MNLPNKLTLTRVIAIPFFLLFISASEETLGLKWTAASFCLATLTVIFAAITDYYDGKIARAMGIVSSFGKLMDPLADKLIVMAGFVGFMTISRPDNSGFILPAWYVIIILAREFFVTGLRQIALEQGIVVSADRLGKHKTGWQLGLLIGVCALLTIRYTLKIFEISQQHLAWFDAVFYWTLNFTIIVVFVLTVWSGIAYFYNNRNLIKID